MSVAKIMRYAAGLMLGLLGLMGLLGPLTAGAAQPAEWTTPLEPFRIAGNLYYVGSKDLASYLVVTPEGNILINSSLPESVPLIERSIEALGFKLTDTRILLISHSHFDHAAGSAALIQKTGAEYLVMDGDVSVVQSGGKTDFAYPNDTYPPVTVSRVLHDGDQVRLGGTTLVAHKTPGHTRGCTTWTMIVKDGERSLNVVIVGSWYVNPGFRLVDEPHRAASYPGIAKDYEHSFEVWSALPCDIFLGAHGAYFDLLGKLQRQKSAVAGSNVWMDAAGYQAALVERRSAFRTELARQQSEVNH